MMKGRSWVGVLVVMAAMSGNRAAAVNTAAWVVGYDPGTGYATDWQTGAGYTNAAAALGLPAASNADGPITPFNAPYTASELVSIGTGGSLTLQFAEAVRNDATHPFGMDFVVYGSTAFMDAAWPSGLTDGAGSTFGSNGGGNPGATRVWVSADNVNFFELHGAPVFDGMFPTDSAGLLGQPTNPGLNAAGSFANKTLAEIRVLYGGSAGGTAYDLGWAVDAGGNAVALQEIQYLRLEVWENRSEIDAVVAVPEPSVLVLAAAGLLAGLWTARRRRCG